LACGRATKSLLQFETEEERERQFVYVCFEFLYFFLHMTLRYAHAQLDSRQRKNLQTELGPLVVLPMIDAFFNHWPEDLKRGMVAEFYQKINDAEREYATCTEVISEDNPIAANALFSKLTRNVLKLSGDSPIDIAKFMVPYGASIQAWKDMHLDKHIEKVRKTL